MFDFIPMDRFPSRREFFGSTIKHLLRQGVRAFGNGSCKYRAMVEGQMVACAVGAWVPNKEYATAMEGFTREGLVLRNDRIFDEEEPRPYIPTVIMLDGQFNQLVWLLQELHDSFMPAFKPLSLAEMSGCDNSALFRGRANRLAEDFGLPVPFVKEPNSGQWQFTYDWCA